MQFTFHMPDELHSELQDAAKERHCSPMIFASETIFAALASRRLPRVAVTVEALVRTSGESVER